MRWVNGQKCYGKVCLCCFADPETGKPTLVFFEVVAPSKSQDAPGLKKATINTFQRNYLESVIEIACFFVRQCFSELQKIFWVDQIFSS